MIDENIKKAVYILQSKFGNKVEAGNLLLKVIDQLNVQIEEKNIEINELKNKLKSKKAPAKAAAKKAPVKKTAKKTTSKK
tara:strand:- start:81 stop:320 length:240 start_codon:yes stop_codon:yes gene_type:complete